MHIARRHPRGFTLLEAVVVVALIGIVAALAASSLTRQRPRATLANTGAELQSIIHNARMSAMATGHDVGVLVFPGTSGTSGSTGRVIVYEDGNFDFFAAGTPKFSDYNPLVLAYGTRSQVVTTLDLPGGIVFGPAAGRGTGATLPAPLDGVDVTKDCTFCDTATVRRGAIRFDSRGRASFYKGGARQAGLSGASLTLTSSDVGGTLTLAVISSTGAVRLVVGP